MVLHTHFKSLVTPTLAEGFNAIYTIPFQVYSAPAYPTLSTPGQDNMSYHDYVSQVIQFHLFNSYLK